MADGGHEENRQHPHNLQGLLHMAIEAGTASDAMDQAEPMPDERRQWLHEAMNKVFAAHEDDVQRMKECLQELNSETTDEEGKERKEKALILLTDLCENLDNACNFCKLGGMELILKRYLSCPEDELRWRAAELIAISTQNEPYVQAAALSHGAVEKLLQLLDFDTCETVRIKSLFAISCMVREHEPGLAEFIRLDGFSALMRAMQSDLEKLRTKATFLLQNLLISHPEHKAILFSIGMIPLLVSLLRTDHSPFHEHVLSALLSIVTDYPPAVLECQAPELALEEVLKQLCQIIDKTCQEQLEYCAQLLKICFQDSPDDGGMDR